MNDKVFGQRWQDRPFYETDDPLDDWNQEEGTFTKRVLANAIQMWSILQDGDTTVGEAAKVFNVAEWKVRAAVEDHPWMFLIGTSDVITHEGE